MKIRGVMSTRSRRRRDSVCVWGYIVLHAILSTPAHLEEVRKLSCHVFHNKGGNQFDNIICNKAFFNFSCITNCFVSYCRLDLVLYKCGIDVTYLHGVDITKEFVGQRRTRSKHTKGKLSCD